MYAFAWCLISSGKKALSDQIRTTVIDNWTINVIRTLLLVFTMEQVISNLALDTTRLAGWLWCIFKLFKYGNLVTHPNYRERKSWSIHWKRPTSVSFEQVFNPLEHKETNPLNYKLLYIIYIQPVELDESPSGWFHWIFKTLNPLCMCMLQSIPINNQAIMMRLFVMYNVIYLTLYWCSCTK